MKNLKRILALGLAAVMTFSFAACGSSSDNTAAPASNDAQDSAEADVDASADTDAAAADSAAASSGIKIGLITLHDENSTYDLNFIKAFKAACEATGAEPVIVSNIGEDAACYEEACNLAEEGCDIVFADSFGHESFLAQAAAEYPAVQFCHATGTTAHTAGLDNLHNAFAAIYEGRYAAGVAAGMKLNEMIEAGTIAAEDAVIGYVGAYPYAEVKSGYTSFFLGARSVCPSATMKVTFTNSWYDETAEKTAAQSLIAAGCVLISQHADSMGAPTACEEAGVPNVSYNGSTAEACPNTFIVSSYINWQPYFEKIINAVANGETIETDYVGTFADGSVCLTAFGANAPAAGTEDAVNAVIDQLKSGSLHVFDTATFTVNGAALDSYMADVDSDEAYTPDTEVVKDGYFAESEFRSAPYFDIDIDGISTL